MPESIGQQLKNARTGKKQSLKQITKAIHIRESYLEAIESDRLDELPSPVQAKGFIRLYWAHIGLPPEELEAIWKPPLPISPVEEQPNPAEKLPAVEAPKSTPKPTPVKVKNIADAPINKDETLRASDLVLRSIGKQLADQRARLSLSVDNIETYTHIASHYIWAMESGDFQQLPSPVQARGMLSNYAGFLDMDTDALLLQYADALQYRRNELMQPTEASSQNRKLPKIVKPGLLHNAFSLDVILVGLLVLAALAALIWGTSSIVAYQLRPQGTITAMPISEFISSSDTPTLTIEVPFTQSPEAVVQSSPSTPDGTTTITTAQLSLTTVPQGAYPIQVFVVALQRAFMQVNVDGKSVFNGRVIPGNPYSFNANKEIELISGNAAALQIVYNQTNVGFIGATGDVVHLIFGLDAYGTPTQTATITPSATLKPSRTPKPSNTYPPTRTKTNTLTPLPTSTPKPTNTPKATQAP